MTTSTSPIRAFHERLRLEHDEIDGALERLLQAYGTGDQEIARTALREFDTRLTAHLQLEEELLLPEFAGVDPVEAEAIAAEHREIRAKVDELAIGSDLHLTRLPAIRDLAEILRAHAEREDDSLYRWVDRTFGDEPVRPPSDEPVRPSASTP